MVECFNLWPLNKCCFIRTIISCIFIKIECFLIFRTSQQHHLIAIIFYCNIPCIIQTLCCQSFISIITMCNYIFKNAYGLTFLVRFGIMTQTQDDIIFSSHINDDKMIYILNYLRSMFLINAYLFLGFFLREDTNITPIVNLNPLLLLLLTFFPR